MSAHMRPLLVVMLATLLGFVAACDKHADDRAAIKDLFDEYQTAIVRRNGKAAADLLSQASIDQQTSMITKVLRLPEADTHMLPASDRLDVLLMRQAYLGDKAAIDRLKKVDGKTHFERAVSSGGMFDPNWGRYTLSNIRFNRTGAEARASAEKAKDWNVYFVRVNDKWLIDQTQYSRLNQTVSKSAAMNKMSEDDYIMAVVGNTLRCTPSPAIWKPLAPTSVEKSPLVDD